MTQQLPNRSPLMMNPFDTALVVVDVQQRLMPAIEHHQQITWNISRLIRGAQELGMKQFLTEQYPAGLGSTVDSVRSLLDQANATFSEKTMFSCRECTSSFAGLLDGGIQKLLVTGVESHVCVLQSVLDFMAHGFNVYVAVDAIGSRFSIDHETALCRMELSGATLVTTEMALFEWCETSQAEKFKAISQLVREIEPE